MEENKELLDSENQQEEELEIDLSEEDKEKSNEETTDDVDALKATIDKLEKTNKQLFARLKKNEQKEVKDKEPEIKNNQLSEDVVLELSSLVASGYTKEDIVELRKIQAGEKAMGKELSLSEAANNPMFVAYKQVQQAKQKKQQAKLGASGGSPEAGSKIEIPTDREEHKKLAMELVKKVK